LRVQVYDSTGLKLIADNYGTTAQQQAYTQFASGAGLPAANGTYNLKVSYAPGADVTKAQKYNFQLYSGTSYSAVYETTATLPTSSNGGKTPNVGIFANSEALLSTRQQFNVIGETATSAVEIGWLKADESRLDVQSQLTSADKTDYYNFTLQQGHNLKLAFN